MNIPTDLLAGYRRFRQERYALEQRLYSDIAKEQKPHTMVIGCADSRVDPATIFGARPGDLFVVRNVAALVPPCEEAGSYHGTSAAVEFAVCGLAVRNIVVLGHGLCGGVKAALAAAENKPSGRFIDPWVALLGSVRDTLLAEEPNLSQSQWQRRLEHLAVRQSLNNLLSFPFVLEAVQAGKLDLQGAWFSIAEGKLEWLDQDTQLFKEVPLAE